MAAPRQMTANTLNALKGWPQPAAVDFHTEFSDAITTEVLPGSVVHLDSDGKYALGVGTDKVMPLFMFNGSNDPDVVNEGGDPATEKGVWVADQPDRPGHGPGGRRRVRAGLDRVRRRHLQPERPADQPDKTGANAGKLQVGTMHTDMIVGIVSRGVVDNGYGTTPSPSGRSRSSRP
jgi:hypothetical protein